MIHVIGTNHRFTSLADRERLTPPLLPAEPRGTILLATCNRMELYADRPGRFDSPTSGAPRLFASSAAYHLRGPEAVTHLFRVAAGLDSLVLGEQEILGQVKEALHQAPAPGPALSRLFRHALHAGKRARRETAISSGPYSVGHCAARLVEGVLGSLEGRRLLLFGAGKIAHLTAKHMVARRAGPICVYSRTHERAQALAHSFGGVAVEGADLMKALQECDVIIGCATAPHHFVGPQELGAALSARAGRPLVVVDLGLPRNVDPAAAALPGLHLFNLDDLEGVVAEHRGARETEVAKVEAIVAEETAAFRRAQAERDTAAVITRLREKAERLRQECLRRGEADRDYLTDLLVRKLLHHPLVALRQAGADDDLAAAAEKLFGLEEE